MPPFTEKTPRQKIQAAEDAWNSRDPERCALAYTVDTEWRNESGQWYRSYGNEYWEFDANGLMAHRCASINDLPIDETERRFR